MSLGLCQRVASRAAVRLLSTTPNIQKSLFNNTFARCNDLQGSLVNARHIKGRIIVFYDGKCDLCTAEIRHYEGLLAPQQAVSESPIAFFDLTKSLSDTQTLLSTFSIPLEDPFRRVHVIADRATGEEAKYEVLVSTKAFCEIWSRVPQWRYVEPAVRHIPGVIQLSDFVYACIAETRLKFLPSK